MSPVPTMRLLAVLARHPRLWVEAMRSVPHLARHRWWRRPPFLPLPDGEYLRWRIATAYGNPEAAARPGDLVAYLEWRRRQR